MVSGQASRLVSAARGYTYLQVYQAVWYLIKIKETTLEDIDRYGIGLLTYSDQVMQDAMAFMETLKVKRLNAAETAEASKLVKVEEVPIKRQKQRIKREEFNWDE